MKTPIRSMQWQKHSTVLSILLWITSKFNQILKILEKFYGMPWTLEMQSPTFWNTTADLTCVQPIPQFLCWVLLSSVAMRDGLSQEGIKAASSHTDRALIWRGVLRRRDPESFLSLSLHTHTQERPCEGTVRSWLSASHEENPH